MDVTKLLLSLPQPIRICSFFRFLYRLVYVHSKSVSKTVKNLQRFRFSTYIDYRYTCGLLARAPAWVLSGLNFRRKNSEKNFKCGSYSIFYHVISFMHAGRKIQHDIKGESISNRMGRCHCSRQIKLKAASREVRAINLNPIN